MLETDKTKKEKPKANNKKTLKDISKQNQKKNVNQQMEDMFTMSCGLEMCCQATQNVINTLIPISPIAKELLNIARMDLTWTELKYKEWRNDLNELYSNDLNELLNNTELTSQAVDNLTGELIDIQTHQTNAMNTLNSAFESIKSVDLTDEDRVKIDDLKSQFSEINQTYSGISNQLDSLKDFEVGIDSDYESNQNIDVEQLDSVDYELA